MMLLKSFLQKELLDYKVLLRSIPSTILLFFTLAVICANLMANKELFQFKYLALDCGVVFSWIMFLSMDIICKRFGAKAAIKISIFALFVNLLVCLSFYLLILVGGNWAEFYSYPPEIANSINHSLNKTFGGTWYVVLGSATAFLISSCINATLNQTIGKIAETKLKKDNFTTFAIRSYVSTFVAQFADNFIFSTIVSKIFFGWNFSQIFFCALLGACFELLFEVLFSKMGYNILKSLEENNIGAEYIDFKKETTK